MSLQYQSLLGLSTLDADLINTTTIDVSGNLNVQGVTTLNDAVIQSLNLPNGAVNGYVLTSDVVGLAEWQPIPDITLVGDASGPTGATVVSTLANGTIPVTDVVLLNASQTLTNKTLTAPTLTGLTLASDIQVTNLDTNSLQMNDGSSQVGYILTSTDIIGNSTWQPPAISVLSGDSNGLENSNTVDSLLGGTVTIPIGVDTLVNKNGVQTLTNKTITGTFTGSLTGNSSTVTTNANLTGDVTSIGNTTTLTNAPVIAKVLTGFTSGAGTVTSSDSILTALQKINGNVVATSGVSTATPNTLSLIHI